MFYTASMRATAQAGHYLLASLPLLGLLALFAALFGTEAEPLQLFRLHKDEHDAFEAVVRFITDWGNPAFYVVYLSILVRGVRWGDRRRVRFVVAYIVAQLLIALLAVTLTKMALGRPRPEADTTLYNMLTLDSYHHSLPSGHTTEITGSCLALALWLGNRRWSLFLGLCIAVMGFSRMYLFQHYPTDVFFGWMLGSVSGFAAYSFGATEDRRRTHG